MNTWLSLAQADTLLQERDEEPAEEAKQVAKGTATSSNIKEMLTKFKTLLESIPLHEPENPSRDELLTSARSRFRAIVARLGLSQTLAGTNKVETLNF